MFGTPVGFASTATEEKDHSYLLTYDGNSESAKMTIKRLQDSVEYVWQKANFLTSGGRSNGNFGIQLKFHNCWFENVNYVYELLNIVFNDRIMQDGVMFDKKTTSTNKDVYKYKFDSFEKIEKYINNLKQIIARNITNEKGVGHIKSISELGEFNQTGQRALLNDKRDNESIKSALKKYNTVAISPEYEIQQFKQSGHDLSQK